MKFPGSVLRLFGLLALAPFAHAQTLDSVIIGRGNNYVQTDGSTVVIDPMATGPTYGGPYGFEISVSGSNLTTAPTVSLPGATNNGTLYPSQHNGGVLGYNSNDDEYEYGSPNFNGIGTTTSADRNTRFPFGVYTVTSPDFADVSVTLQATANPFSAPVFTLTGGTWSNGSYVVNVASVITFSTSSNAFSGFSENANGGILFRIDNQTGTMVAGTDFPTLYSDNNSAANYIDYTLSANSLVSGMTYTVYGGYIAIVDQNSTNGSFNVAFINNETHFTITAVPEPASVGLLFGLGVLGWIVGCRWRRPAGRTTSLS